MLANEGVRSHTEPISLGQFVRLAEQLSQLFRRERLQLGLVWRYVCTASRIRVVATPKIFSVGGDHENDMMRQQRTAAGPWNNYRSCAYAGDRSCANGSI